MDKITHQSKIIQTISEPSVCVYCTKYRDTNGNKFQFSLSREYGQSIKPVNTIIKIQSASVCKIQSL